MIDAEAVHEERALRDLSLGELRELADAVTVARDQGVLVIERDERGRLVILPA